MKTKTVTIHNWDGSKYKVKAPVEAKYLGILSHTGCINFYARKPRLNQSGYYSADPNAKRLLENGIDHACPCENLPYHDGYGNMGTVIKKGINVAELLLKIEEV